MFRVDSIDYSAIDKLCNSGFKRLGFGLEHTDKKILKKMRKIQNCEKTINKIKYILNKGIQVEIFFIIFSKWETWDTLVKLVYDICAYIIEGADFLYNWGFQPLYGSDLRQLDNKYIDYKNSTFVTNSKVIPDDPFIGKWFRHMNSNKAEFFKFQDELEIQIYKQYFLEHLKDNNLFHHALGNNNNLNNSTTLKNLIRILSMFLWGEKHFSKNNVEWDTVINYLYLTIFQYTYRYVILIFNKSSDNNHLKQKDFNQVLKVIKKSSLIRNHLNKLVTNDIQV